MSNGTIRVNLNIPGLKPTAPVQPIQPQGVPVPQPMARTTQTAVDAGDRQVSIVAQLMKPRIIVFGGVFSHDECDRLIEMSRPKLARSLVVDAVTGKHEDHAARTSEGTYFLVEENDFVAALDRRIAKLLNWPVENGEGLQILHYKPGGEYQAHYDYLDPKAPGATAVGGNRVASLIIYLDGCSEGGWTRFPDVGFEVAPIKGNAVFFSYDRPSPETHTLHAGMPVIEGEKWIATRWVRERPYR